MTDDGPALGREAQQAAAPVAPAAPAADARPVEPDYRDLYLRASAELDNYRKRAEREKASLVQYAAESIVRRLLEPFDSLGRALLELERVTQGAPDDVRSALRPSLEGLRALQRQWSDLLASEGVEPIAAQGEEFDPAVHEALVHVPDPAVPSGKVLEVLQTGYTIRGKIVRPARVAVSSGPAQPADAPPEAPPSAHAHESTRPGRKPRQSRHTTTEE